MASTMAAACWASPGRCLFPAQKAARFHFIGRQGCWLFSPAKEWIELTVGDALLIPRGDEHVLASAPGLPALPIDRYSDRTGLREHLRRLERVRAAPKTLLFCGSMHFNLDGSHPLLDMMPDLMRAHELTANAPGIQHLLDAMAGEVTMDRVGSGGILARLADVLGCQIIRSWVEHGCGDATGWIAAVRNPDIGQVLAAIHLQPDRDWTVEALAGSWAPRAPPLPSALPRWSARRRRSMSCACGCIRRGNGWPATG